MIDNPFPDLFFPIVMVALVVAVVYLFAWVKVLQRQIDTARSEIFALKPRTGAVAHARTSRGVPTVDAHARTTRRDSDDLPTTGRMSQGVKRVKTNGRSDDPNRGLPDSSGYPPT